MAITQILGAGNSGGSVAAAAATSVTLNTNLGSTLPGDYLIGFGAIIDVGSPGAPIFGFNVPPGVSILYQNNDIFGGINYSLTSFSRVLTGGEPTSYTFSFPQSAYFVVFAVYRGVDTNFPIAAASVMNLDNAFTAASMNIQVANTLTYWSGMAWVPTSGATQLKVPTPAFGPPNSDQWLNSFLTYADGTTAFSTGNTGAQQGSGTNDGPQCITQMIALAPAGANEGLNLIRRPGRHNHRLQGKGIKRRSKVYSLAAFTTTIPIAASDSALFNEGLAFTFATFSSTDSATMTDVGTPVIVGVDAVAFTDTGMVTISGGTAVLAGDAFRLTETTTILATFTASDAATLGETTQLVTPVTATDGATLLDITYVLNNITSDAATLADSTTSTTSTGPSAVDAFTLTDGYILAPQVSVDAITMAEAITLSPLGSDALTLTEATVVGQSATDAATFTDVGLFTQSGTDSATLAETASISVTLTASDAATLAEAFTILVSFTGTDSAVLTDTGLPGLSGSESITLTDVGIPLPGSGADAMAMAETATLGPLGTDGASLSESVALTMMFGAIDAFTLTELGVLSAGFPSATTTAIPASVQ